MTVTNHMLTGAVIALTVHHPAIAIPLAFLSHFALDALPHYGYGFIPYSQRDKQPYFLAKQVADGLLALTLFLVVPYATRYYQLPIITQLAMLAAYLPDGLWTYHYLRAQRTGRYGRPDWFSRLHKRIQWCERSWGIYVELGWLGGMAALIRLVA